ncbi:MAG: sugar ABC transporter permease [Anaerolineae bacterium]
MFSGLSMDIIANTLGTLVPLLIVVLGGSIILQLVLYQFLSRVLKTPHALPYTLLAPAAVALIVFMVYPLVYNVMLAFSDLKRDTYPCYSPVAIGNCELDHLYGLDYAWENFKDVFVRERNGEILGWGRLLRTADSTFPILLARTFVWTSINVIFHFTLGMILALIMNQKLRFKNIYRSLIVIPWAIPSVIVGLTWRQEFHAQYGFVNVLIQSLGGPAISWLDDPGWAFVAVLFVNIWLGVPFYMIMLLGGLQSISQDYYEAAQMDGANSVDRFWNITLPLLRPIIIPAITLDVIWTFNKLDIIFIVTGGGPQESTNILVSALYNAAFGPAATSEFGFASAFSIVIFLILFVFAVVWITTSGGLKEIYDR